MNRVSQGTKARKCSFAQDKKDAASRGVPYDYDDKVEAEALTSQRDDLEVLDIWLPEL